MRRKASTRVVWATGLVAAMAALSACGKKEPPKPAPPPPVAIVIPPRPQPPMGAAPNLTIPVLGPDGQRRTVNSGLTPAQAVWNLRSAYNVAALNCTDPRHAAVLAGYKTFLKTHARSLKAANATVDKEFRTRFGREAIRQRETYQTQVYNFFAIPPVVPSMCNAALDFVNEIALVPAGKLDGYAPAGLARLETPYRDFFNSYNQYQADLAAWRARYEPGPVAVSVPGATQAYASQTGVDQPSAR